MEKDKLKIHEVSRKEHLIMLKNSIMAKVVNDEMDCAIWASELALMHKADKAKDQIQKSFDQAQGLILKRLQAINWIDKEIALCDGKGLK